ncbi:MAG: PASTA domain-containing protein [Clostridia bacterium]|nr:PASTA domain-containing protein [Clostridia bacterium]
MGFYNNLCPGCMNEVGDSNICPYCGFNLKSEQSAPFLAYGTVLAGKYVVGDILEQNSEGVTYLGLDTITNNCVRIREFLPETIMMREKNETKITVKEDFRPAYKTLITEFLNMWHALMRLKSNEDIITVLDVFEANDTAYAVAEADGNQTLSDYLDKKDGKLTWDDINEKLFPVIDALSAINNAGVIHGAISPDTLFLCSNGKFKPWGFSVSEARKVDAMLDADIRPGYAAIEQYNAENELTAATDVYGLISVMYRCITGSVPIDAEIRSKEDTLSIPAPVARELPDYVLAAFIGALQVNAEDRTQNMSAFRRSFSKEAFEQQKKHTAEVAVAGLIDPISDMESDEEIKTPKEQPVVVNATQPIPVVVNDPRDDRRMSTAATIILSISIVAVMLIFFLCLGLTGVVSYNFGGGTTAKVVEIPDFTNYSKTDAFIAEVADEYGLHIKLQATSSSTVAQGVIFDQDIAPGTKVERGSTINLYYSKGASTVTLPDFTGMTFTETVYYLGKLNLSYNIVEKENTGTQKAGTVSTMTPAANSVVYEGTEITLEVWGEAPANGDVVGENTGSEITSSTSILDSIFGSLSDSVSGLSETIQNFIG